MSRSINVIFTFLIFAKIWPVLTILTHTDGATWHAHGWRRPALAAPSLGVVGTSRSSVRIARPTTTTDEDNVGYFGLKEMDEQRTESGEGLPLPPASGQRRTFSPTGASSVSTSGSTSFSLVDIIFWLFTKLSQLVDTCRYLNRVGAKQQISANILAI